MTHERTSWPWRARPLLRPGAGATHRMKGPYLDTAMAELAAGAAPVRAIGRGARAVSARLARGVR